MLAKGLLQVTLFIDPFHLAGTRRRRSGPSTMAGNYRRCIMVLPSSFEHVDQLIGTTPSPGLNKCKSDCSFSPSISLKPGTTDFLEEITFVVPSEAAEAKEQEHQLFFHSCSKSIKFSIEACLFEFIADLHFKQHTEHFSFGLSGVKHPDPQLISSYFG